MLRAMLAYSILNQIDLKFQIISLSQVLQYMASDHRNGMVLVIMGVSGAGKSTIGEMLAKKMNSIFIDADDYHSQSNKEKMSKGVPLSDKDRIPWLETLQRTLRDQISLQKLLILGCSALQNKHREILRSSDPNYALGSHTSAVKFVLLDAPTEVIASRLEKRAAEGKHFMSSKLLQSQFDLLEIDESEGILVVDATQSPHCIVSSIASWILLPNSETS